MVANLPYVTEGERETMSPELSHDPDSALFSGADGLDHIRRFLSEAQDYLNPKGLVALEIGHQQADAVFELLNSFEFTEIDIRPDLSGVSRFPLARKK